MSTNANYFKWFSQAEISTPKNGYQAVVDSYWEVNEHGQVAVYRTYHPQCNTDKRVTEIVLKKGIVPGATGMVFIPLAFIPIDFRE